MSRAISLPCDHSDTVISCYASASCNRPKRPSHDRSAAIDRPSAHIRTRNLAKQKRGGAHLRYQSAYSTWRISTQQSMDDPLAGAINKGILPHLALPAPPHTGMDNDYHDFRAPQHPPASFDAAGNSALFNDILANLAEEDKAATAATGHAARNQLGYPTSAMHGISPHVDTDGMSGTSPHPQTYISSTYQSRARNGQGPVPPPPAAGMMYMPVPRPTGASEGPQDGGEVPAGNGRARPNRSNSLDSSGGSEYDESKDKAAGARGEEKHECKWHNCKQ